MKGMFTINQPAQSLLTIVWTKADHFMSIRPPPTRFNFLLNNNDYLRISSGHMIEGGFPYILGCFHFLGLYSLL